MRKVWLIALALPALTPAPLAAKESLGVFSNWGAFRDTSIGGCYAIAMARPSRSERNFTPYATITNWPKRRIRGQIQFRLSRKINSNSPISLRIGSRSFRMTGTGNSAWAQNGAGDAAIVAAIRSASTMTISAGDSRGRRFSDSYTLTGAATALDATVVGCAAA